MAGTISAKLEQFAEASSPLAGHADREPREALQCEGCSEQQVMFGRGSLRSPQLFECWSSWILDGKTY